MRYIIIAIFIVVCVVIGLLMMVYGAGKNRDWERDDQLQEEALREYRESKLDKSEK
jgi:uncharacterized membrane protein